MVMLEMRAQLKTLAEEGVKIETQLNRLQIEKGNLLKQKDNNEKALSFNQRKQLENKREMFAMQMQIDKAITEEENRKRQAKVNSLKASQPSFDDLLKKEINALVNEGEELGMELGEGIDAEDLWLRYMTMQNDRHPTRENIILGEAKKHYDELITSLVNKELDGQRIDLLEKRNIKMPILNFLNNRFIKNELRI